MFGQIFMMICTYFINLHLENKLELFTLEQRFEYGPIYPNGPVDYCGFMYYFLLRGPVDGACKLSLIGTLNVTLFIDDKEVVSIFSNFDNYTPYTFEKDKIYKGQINFFTGEMYAFWALFIKEGNKNKESIYHSHFYSIENVGVFPANQVNIIKCTSNYNITSKICTPICGDGIKVDKEECDDNNTSNGDGCSNVCKIEQGFQCIIDSSGKSYCQNISSSSSTTINSSSDANANSSQTTSTNSSQTTNTNPSQTTNTNPSQTPNTNSSQTSTNNPTNDNQSGDSTNCSFNCTTPSDPKSNLKKYKNFEWFIILCGILALLCSIICLGLNSKFRSFNIEHLQIISLLALTNSELCTDLENFFKMIGNSLFCFSFINPPNFLKFYQDNDQANTILKQELSKLGFRTISTIANIFYYIISWILVAVLTITILKIMKCLKNKYKFLQQKLGNNLNDINKTFIKIQIQYTYLGFLPICLSCIYEINYICSTSFNWTFIFPCTFMLLCAIVLSLNFVYSLTEYCPKWLSTSYKSLIIQTEENENPIKLYRFVRLTYLLLLSTVVCISNNQSAQLILMLILQICFFNYLFTYSPLGTEMKVQPLIFGCLECVYTVIFIISNEVNLLLILIFFVSQLSLLVKILINSRILTRFCSKSRSSVENDQNTSENNQDKSGNPEDESHHNGSFEPEDIVENQDFEMPKEEQKDSTQVYKNNDLKLKYIPIQENNKLFESSIGSKITEETKDQFNNNRDSLSKDTDRMEIEINSDQEDDICIDICDSKLNGFNINESNQIMNVYFELKPKTARRNNPNVKKFY